MLYYLWLQGKQMLALNQKGIKMKKKYFLVLDTETCGDVEKNPLVYDVGAQIIDLHGNVLESGSWVVYDIYVGLRDLMKTAYYAEKLPQYERDLKQGKRKMAKLYTIRKTLLEWVNKYEVEAICAYNARFDIRALNNTFKHTTNGKYYYFFPKKLAIIDIWHMAVVSICSMESYCRMAYEHGFVTEKGNMRTTAEMVYAYLINVPDFEESHTGLEDVQIEVQIFLYCWKKTKPEQRVLRGNPWRIPQPYWNYVEAKTEHLI